MEQEKPSAEAPDPEKIIDHAYGVQFMLRELNAKLEDIEVDGQSDDGLIRVTMACDGRMVNIDIHDSLHASDPDIISAIALGAIHQAIDNKDKMVVEETERMMKKRGFIYEQDSGQDQG